VFIADFMGEANILPCDIERVDNGEALITLGSRQYRVPGAKARPGAAQLSVRPQFITLQPEQSGALNGEVTHSAWLGDHIEYEVKTDLGALFIVDVQMERQLTPTTRVAIDFKSQGLALIAQ
jgi:iron(III) transport system ATP-binding protein